MNNLSSLIRLSSRQQRAGKNVAASRVCFSSQEYCRNDVVLTLEEVSAGCCSFDGDSLRIDEFVFLTHKYFVRSFVRPSLLSSL